MLVCFLCFSASLSEEKASIYLNAINRYSGKKPWLMTFTYGRRLLHAHMLDIWNGKVEHFRHAQGQLLKQLHVNRFTLAFSKDLHILLRFMVLRPEENMKRMINHLLKLTTIINDQIYSFFSIK